MRFAAYLSSPDLPPMQVPPFDASDDAAALAIVQAVADRLGPPLGTTFKPRVWQSADGLARVLR